MKGVDRLCLTDALPKLESAADWSPAPFPPPPEPPPRLAADDWNCSVIYGLEESTLVLPLISQYAVDSIAKNAPRRRDNLLMGEEWFWV